MNLDLKNIKEWLAVYYDKAALFAVLFALLVSVGLLLVFLDKEEKELTAARWELPAEVSRPVPRLDLTNLLEAVEVLADPYQLPLRTKRIFTAEMRTACVQCGRPIPFDAAVCPYRNCAAPQPITPQTLAAKDSDGDGMPDEWEKQHGLNAVLNDAPLDADGDGFSNLEEHLAGTNPKDAGDFPPPVTKLKVLKIGRMPMPLSFQGIQRLTTNEVVFTVRNNATHRDYYVRLNETVEGYLVAEFDPKVVPVKKGNLTIQEDQSVLRLKKDGRVIPLMLGRGVGQGDPIAQLVFELDGAKMVVKAGDHITLKNVAYKIVDIRRDVVVALDGKSGKQFELPLIKEDSAP